ncbi:ATP-binding protein [Granulosicoccus sp. 3-233]|uniref:GAF domain-containing sensor histidine kinase n=1 Tax=Granulosicoccus sp. 3-233 TaxID=3417969 RepID=UPI003D325CCF
MPDPAQALACFLSIARTIAGPTEYDTVLRNFANGLRSLIPHDHLDIVLLHASGIQICYEARLHTSWSQLKNRLKPTECSPIRDVLWGNADHILTDDAWQDDRFHFDGADNAPIFEANLHSRIIVPLRVKGEITGSLAISSHRTAQYDERLVEIAQGAADLVAAYLFALERGREARDAAVAESEARGREEALRLGAQNLTEGMEQERQRLGMDLHDQTLADLARLSRRLAKVRSAGRFDEEMLLSIEHDLENSLVELRGIVEDMKPGVLQLFGFADAIEAHLQRCTANLKSAVETQLIDASRGIVDTLPESVTVSLYRMVQEAINNAVKHAEARRIEVQLVVEAPCLYIRIRDDGIGIASPEHVQHGGIANIHTRAALVFATVSITQVDQGCGTQVELCMPLPADMLETLEVAR